jgi:hypothetical protein
MIHFRAMAGGLAPAIHVLLRQNLEDVDARHAGYAGFTVRAA